ncbi:unnamed protein product [Trifolium pratense]|uniref:Uncharacterized protein n=1 Tax=Trifolium pratense TaxID=57577 RepID=A0ACB0LXC9_TRIPR|nr:unnamed protein product [Trifolium pratense]
MLKRETSYSRKMPNFISPLSEYVLQTELPRGWKIPKFTKFAGDTTESTVEHVARFFAEAGNLADNKNLRLKYFPNSLTKNAFTWFTTLPPRSIQHWTQLERAFHEQFYMGQSKISLKELASVRRKTPESIDDYLNRFRLLKARCFTQVPEHELVEMAAGGLDYSIRKKLDTQHLRDMAQLADRVRQVERLKAEKARSSKHQRQQRLSLQEAQKTEDNKGKQVVEVARRPLKERLTQPEDDKKVENEFEGEDMEDEDLLDSDPEFDVLVNVVSILPAEYDVWSEVTEGEDEFDESELALHKPMCYYMALEATMLQENMAIEANNCENGKLLPMTQKMDCIYDEEPLGFEKDPSSSSQKMQAQDPLEEIDIGDGSIKRPTYISANIPKDLRDKLVELLKEFKDCFAWDYNEMPEHVPRIENQEANDLAQIASGYKVSKEKLEQLIEIKEKLISNKPMQLKLSIPKLEGAEMSPNDINSTDKEMNYDEFQIFVIDNLVDGDWRKPIVEYLENPIGSAPRKIKYRASNYVIIGNELFKKTLEGVLLKCLSENEAYIAISDVHSGACGSHQSGHKMKWLLVRQGMFGIPETITTDQGSVFTGRKMQEFARQTGFKLLTSTPYYAQANGQVEAANKIIIGLIRKHIAQKPRNWNKTLNQVLWACRNSPKESTNSTPFRLTYGHDAVLPVEIYLQSIRIQRQMEIPTDHYWSMMFDELVDLDEERLRALDTLSRQKERVAKAYNKKVKSKTFDVGNLVWKVILPMDKKDRVLGKWSPNWEGPFKIIQVFSNGAYEIEELTPENTTRK